MSITDSVHSSRDQNIPRESSFQPNREKICQLAVKITVIVLTTLALAAATYFTLGLALSALMSAAITWQSGLFMIAGLGFGLTTLSTPVIAGFFNMYKFTEHNALDIIKFLSNIILTAGMSGIIFTFGYFYNSNLQVPSFNWLV